MPVAEKYHADFDADQLYHIYNRTNNGEPLFRSEENCRFFLKRYKAYLNPFVDTFSWNLLPNHFHLLVRVKPLETIRQYLSDGNEKPTVTVSRFLQDDISINEVITGLFKNFFQSYAQSYNKLYGRKGNLFYKCFKRVMVETEEQFTKSVVYIHGNPVKHRLVADFSAYKWSSWHDLVGDGVTFLQREELLGLFGGRERFIRVHREMIDYHYLKVSNL